MESDRPEGTFRVLQKGLHCWRFFPLKLSEDFQHLDPPRQAATSKVAILSAVLLRRPEIYVRNSPLLPGQKLRGQFSSDGIPDSWLPLSADVELPTLINTSRMVASSPVLACEGSVESEAVQLPFGGAQRWGIYRHPRPPDRSIS
jgi:hypothetical protein